MKSDSYDKQRRKSFRMPFVSEAVCFMHDSDIIIKGIIRDISISALYVTTDDFHDVTGGCNLQLIMEGTHSRIDVTNLSGKVVRSDQNGLAIAFDHPLEWVALVAIYGSKMNIQNQSDEERLYRRS